MKVLWLSHLVPYPPKAGVLLRAHYLVKELAKHHEVDLLAFNQKALIEPFFDDYKSGTEIAKSKMQEICGRVELFDCPVDRSKNAKIACALKSLFSSTPYNVNWLKDEAFAKKVLEWCATERYDLIHCDTISLAPYVKDLSNIKLSLDHHNVESHMLFRRSQHEKSWLKKFYFYQEAIKLKKYETAVCPTFDINLTCSDLDTARFQDFIPDAEFVEIPNGVDTQLFTPSNKEPEPCTLIFIGTLDWYPNTRAVRYIAKELWSPLQAAIPNIKINIIGAGAPRDLVDFANTTPNFNVLGFVDDLNPYLEQATAYVCPIDDGGGTKLKLLDAFSAGKAVVAHTIACEGLKVTNGENVILCNQPDAYVKAIKEIVVQPEVRKRLESNARQHAEQHFSFASIGKRLSDVFEKTVSRNQAITESV